MTSENQNINGLAAAYYCVFGLTLRERVLALVDSYGRDPHKLDHVCTELNPDNPVPCFWSLSELATYYGA